jgi:hypothetical protein
MKKILIVFVFIVFISGCEIEDEPYNTQEVYDEYVETGEIDWESVYGDDWTSYLKEELEEEGYRVIQISVRELDSVTPDPLSTYFGDEKPIGKKKIRVEMESMGERSRQIKSVITNSVLMENIYGFWIEIHSPTNTCTYTIKWDDWSSCLNDYNCNINTFLLEESLLICR